MSPAHCLTARLVPLRSETARILCDYTAGYHNRHSKNSVSGYSFRHSITQPRRSTDSATSQHSSAHASPTMAGGPLGESLECDACSSLITAAWTTADYARPVAESREPNQFEAGHAHGLLPVAAQGRAASSFSPTSSAPLQCAPQHHGGAVTVSSQEQTNLSRRSSISLLECKQCSPQAGISSSVSQENLAGVCSGSDLDFRQSHAGLCCAPTMATEGSDA